MTIIWCMVPEIWSAADIIFCHSGLFFALLAPYGPRKSKFWKNEKNTGRYYYFTNVYNKWQSYDVWFLRYGIQRTEFVYGIQWTEFVILDHFLPFPPAPPPPPNNLKNQNFEKMKKTRGDIITLHRWTKNHDQMLPCSWETMCDGYNS